MLDSGSQSQICFAKILCSVTEWGSKKVLSTPSPSSQVKELRMKGGLVRAGYKALHTSSYTNPSRGCTSLQMYQWSLYSRSDSETKWHFPSTNPYQGLMLSPLQSSSLYMLMSQERDMFSSSLIVHPFGQIKHFTKWVVILEQMHITQVNPSSLIKIMSDSRALVWSLPTTTLRC